MKHDEAHTVKTLVIGLDGTTFAVLRPLMNGGRMPFLASLAASGVAGSLRSTLPPVTAPAWSSFFTGKNPGKHGLFNWQRPLTSKTGLKRKWVSSEDIRSDKIWHILGRAGYKVGIMNVPMTYPPEVVNGFMVTGMLTPGPESTFTYPATLKEELFQLVPDYIIDVDIMGTERDLSNATEELFSSFVEMVLDAARLRTVAATKLVRKYKPDFFMLVYTLPDRLQHSSYHRMLEAANDSIAADARAQKCIQALIALDQELERLVSSTADENTLIVIMSDHGFCHHRYNVYLNGWLADQRMLQYRGKSTSLRQFLRTTALKFKRFIPKDWMSSGRRALSAEQLIDWSATKAYCGQTTENGLYINLIGREPFGIVEQEEYEPLRRNLRSKLTELVDPLNQAPIFRKVYLREGLYDGPFIQYAPDIVFELQEGYNAVSTPSSSFRLEDVSASRRGIHSMDGIFIARGPMIQPADEIDGLSIVDVVPNVLYAMNLPISDSMDGKVLQDLFREEHRGREIQYIQEEVAIIERVSSPIYDDKEEAEVEQRLRALGYLD